MRRVYNTQRELSVCDSLPPGGDGGETRCVLEDVLRPARCRGGRVLAPANKERIELFASAMNATCEGMSIGLPIGLEGHVSPQAAEYIF